MSDTAAAQLRRILHLIPHLADGEPHPLDEVARRARVGRAAVLRDLQSISERFEVPGGFVEGLQILIRPDHTVSVHSNHFLRPMRLTRGELCALELGLVMLRGERPPEEHAAIEGARERLRTAIARVPEDDAGDQLRAASLPAAASLEHLRVLREAHRGRRKVRITYRKGAEQASSQRVICPYGIVFASGMWYAVAQCESTDGIRFFRVDRVEGVDALEARFEPPADFALDEVVREGRAFRADGAGVLRVRYSPRIARWIAEREGRTPDQDGSLTVDHPLADPDWAVRHVLQYGPDATVLEPESVREAVVQRVRRIAQT